MRTPFSSTAIVLPISGTRSQVGKAALSMLLFEDIMIVPIVFTLGAMAPYAQEAGWEGLVTTLWQGALVVGVLLVAARLALPRLFAQATCHHRPAIFAGIGEAEAAAQLKAFFAARR